MKGRSPNVSSRVSRIKLTRKKNNIPVVAMNNYFFGELSSPPVPIIQMFGA